MRRNQKGFTLMELMVVIVIVAILAAVAVPLYINYVKDAQRTEAKGAIGAIITAEQAYYQRWGRYLKYEDTDFENLTNPDPTNRLDCDITEARRHWSFRVTLEDGFTVFAKQRTAPGAAALEVEYRLQPPPNTQQWTDK